MDKLNAFYADVNMRNTVHEFLIDTLKELIIKSAFSGKDTIGIAEAKLAIDTAFVKMENMFEPKKTAAPKNQAR